ncbi:MAG TPA: hypothetical protein VE954_21015 [Oligoflexus sp.]|uniref:hypothetical protein n=1 Tax=Oligoflexus sp. TaxID=1971216 RepID=UPI002D56B70E|nr:hypothetical protein [Oligoflexus sp.]HYX35586.1 hypothetical protein [Oligoflexus sp.]
MRRDDLHPDLQIEYSDTPGYGVEKFMDWMAVDAVRHPLSDYAMIPAGDEESIPCVIPLHEHIKCFVLLQIENEALRSFQEICRDQHS